jgi:hypothetical protein
MAGAIRIDAHNRLGALHQLRIFKVTCAIYGAGAIATFVWMFQRLSGLSSCNAGWDSCEAATGSAGLLALAWPAYWGGEALGTPLALQAIPIEVGLAVLLGFASMVVFSLALNRLR